MKLLSDKHISSLHLLPGDTLTIACTNKNGQDEVVLDHYKIDECLEINRIKILEAENDHGFKKAMVVMLGENDGK